MKKKKRRVESPAVDAISVTITFCATHMASKMSKNWNSYNAHLWFGVLRTSGPGTFSSAPCYYGITALHEGHVRYTQELAVRVTKNLKQKSEATSLCTRLTTLWVKRKSRCITNTVHLLHSYYGSPLALAKATLKPRKIMKNKVSQKLRFSLA